MPQVDSWMGAPVDVWGPALIQHRVRIIRVGVLATFVALGAFIVFRVLPGGESIPDHIFVPLWTAAAVAGLAALAAPWERLFGSNLGRWVLYGWSVVDILLITALIWWVPEEDPTFFLCYVLTTVFFSLLYSRRSQVGLFLFTAACYGGLYVAGETSMELGDAVLRIGLLAGVTVLASFSSGELMRGVLEATAHREQAEREKSLHESLAQDLRGREELFRAVSELASDFVYSMRIGPNGAQTWEWVTDGFTSVTGYQITDAAVNSGPASLIHPDDQAIASDIYRYLLSAGGRVRHELRIVTKSGDDRWIAFFAEAVFDEVKQRVTRVFGTAQDVTEKKRAEKAGIERSEILEAISELTSDYVYAVRFTPDGGMEWIWVTDGLRRVTGYSPDEVERQGWQMLMHPDDQERANDVFEKLFLEPESSIVLDHRILTKEGSTKHVRTHARSIRDEGDDGFVRVHGAVQDVTDRHLAQEALRESERRYRSLFDRLPLGMFVRTFDGEGIDANPACVEMFGYPNRDAFVSTHAREIYVDPTERERFVSAIQNQEEAVLETELRRYDGSTFWGLMHARAARDADGNPLFIEGAISDVTDRRQAEQALKHSVSLLRSTIESTWDGLLVVALDGRIETYNSRFVDMWGLDEAVLSSGDDDQALAAVLDRLKDPEGFVDRVRELYANPERESFDVIEMKDGRILERFSRPQRRDDHVVGRVWSFRDVTERKQHAKQLEESLALLRATLESVGEGILVIGEDDEIVAYNDRFAEMWNIPKDLLTNGDRDSVTQLAADRVKDRSAFLSSSERISELGAPEQGELIELADGRLLERFTRDASEAGIDRVLSFRDITQRRALEEQLRQAQKMEAVGRLAGGVAHDFNNLLTAILGYCELLRSTPGISEEIRADIQEIDVAAQMGADITAQLLDLSRRRVLRQEILDVGDVVRNMQPMLKRLIGDNLALDVRIDEGPSCVDADRSQIEQILLNLVVNARDALPEGGDVIVSARLVELSAREASKGLRLTPGPHVLLSVSDNGVGIEPEVRDRIFEPFFTTRHGGSSTGLGLSTVYGIVSQYNGHIAVRSNRGVGSTFRVYLPAATETAVPIASRRAAERWLAGSETVLLVEDDDAIRRLTKRALSRYGYRVLDAPGGIEALELSELTADGIQLLLTDIVMPGIGGRELGTRLAELRPGIRVLYMSGYTGEALARFGDLAWNEDFLAKPFRPEALAGKVREILNREKPHSASR